MLEENERKIIADLPSDVPVLDVGGWYRPFARADWVLDLMPYATRGPTSSAGEAERFTPETWIQRDVCDRTPWPFEDGQFGFAVCSHTLEDVRDPVWVCSELARVATAGYLEVPSRLEEQTWGVNGEFAGWSHHHWLIDLGDNAAGFTLKPHFLHARPDLQLSLETLHSLDPRRRVQFAFWEQKLDATETIHYHAEELENYLRAPLEDFGLPTRESQKIPMRTRLRSVIRRRA